MGICFFIQIFILIFLWNGQSFAESYWLEVPAHSKEERTQLIKEGFDIVAVEADRVIVLGQETHLNKLKLRGQLLASYSMGISPFDFPNNDNRFRNYQRMSEYLQKTAESNRSVATLSSIGTTLENRKIWSMRLSSATGEKRGSLPAMVFIGGHHAREHVAVEIPLMLISYLIDQYNSKNPRIVSLLSTHEVYVIPLLNPDGAEYDIQSGKYISWRKNKSKNSDGSYGVDLNRNYGYGWEAEGASDTPTSDVYRGPAAFSEIETQSLKSFVESHKNLKMMLSYHTFSQLIMWPWSYSYDDISNARDLQVYKTMAQKMAGWTGYSAQKSSDMYISGGDTCDWAYAEHGIFAFTFELDPKSMWDGGFYPGAGVLDSVFNKNIESALYMIEASSDPYKVLVQ